MCEHGQNGIKHRSCYVKNLIPKDKKVGFLDIETTNLDANFGMMLCWAIKPLNKQTVYYVISKKDFDSGQYDKEITKKLIKEIEKYDVIVTYYGTKFDIPYARTRALNHNINFPLPRTIRHIDVYYLAKNKLKLNSNRLATVSEFLKVGGKTKLDNTMWVRASIGHKKSLEYVLEHNIKDVEVLERTYLKLLPFLSDNICYI